MFLLLLIACQDYDLNKNKAVGSVPGPALRVSPDSLTFASQAFGQTERLPVTLESIGDEAVNISALSIAGSGSFTLTNDVRGELEPLESTELWVAFSPGAPTNEAQLAIASNDGASPRQLVDLYGDGEVPLLVADPVAVDFGVHALGQVDVQVVHLKNAGAVDLQLRSVVGTGEGLSYTVPGAMNLAPGEGTDVVVNLKADAYAAINGAIWADSTSISGPLQVPVVGTIAAVPVALCSASPNPGLAGETVDWVGSASFDPTGQALGSYEWVVTERPLGSSAYFEGTGPDRTMIPDLPGHYAAMLTVATVEGLTATCETSVDVVPGQELWIQLTWTMPSDDLDLHLLRDGGDPYSGNDCWFANCRDHELGWGLAINDKDDPSLNLDDIEGLGPETMEIPEPADGVYEVVVNDFWGRWNEAANEATVKIYVRGVLTWTDTRTLAGDDTLTSFATVDWPSGVVTPQ